MVIEQGSVMDRIDQNVFDARFHAHEGKDELEKVLKKENSPKASACIVCLVQSIMICIGIICF